MKEKGKNYANRKSKEERPEGDFYLTPPSLIWVMKDIIKKEFTTKDLLLEPCAGKGSIVKELNKCGYNTITNDLVHEGSNNYKCSF